MQHAGGLPPDAPVDFAGDWLAYASTRHGSVVVWNVRHDVRQLIRPGGESTGDEYTGRGLQCPPALALFTESYGPRHRRGSASSAPPRPSRAVLAPCETLSPHAAPLAALYRIPLPDFGERVPIKSARAAASGMWPLVALSVLPAPHPHGVGPHPAADGVLALFSLRVPPNERDAWAARVNEGTPHASTAVPPLRLAHEDTAWIRRAASLPGSPGLGAPMWRRGSYDSPALLLLHAQGGNAGTEAGGEPFLRARGQPLTSATSALDRSDGAPRPAGAAFRVQAVGGRHLLAAEAASPHGAAPHGGATDSLLRLLPRFSRLAACCADATTGVVYAIGDLASDAEGRPSCHVATCDRALRVLAVSPIKGPSPATRAGAGRSGAGKEEEQKEEDSGRITSACLVGASLAVGTAGGRVGTWDFSRGAVTAGVEPARWIPAAAGAMHPSLLAARARGPHWAVQRLVPACARVPVRRASSAAGERRRGRTPAREPTSLAPEWRIAVARRGGGVDVCDASLQRVLRRIPLVGSPAASLHTLRPGHPLSLALAHAAVGARTSGERRRSPLPTPRARSTAPGASAGRGGGTGGEGAQQGGSSPVRLHAPAPPPPPAPPVILATHPGAEGVSMWTGVAPRAARRRAGFPPAPPFPNSDWEAVPAALFHVLPDGTWHSAASLPDRGSPVAVVVHPTQATVAAATAAGSLVEATAPEEPSAAAMVAVDAVPPPASSGGRARRSCVARLLYSEDGSMLAAVRRSGATDVYSSVSRLFHLGTAVPPPNEEQEQEEDQEEEEGSGGCCWVRTRDRAALRLLLWGTAQAGADPGPSSPAPTSGRSDRSPRTEEGLSRVSEVSEPQSDASPGNHAPGGGEQSEGAAVREEEEAPPTPLRQGRLPHALPGDGSAFRRARQEMERAAPAAARIGVWRAGHRPGAVYREGHLLLPPGMGSPLACAPHPASDTAVVGTSRGGIAWVDTAAWVDPAAEAGGSAPGGGSAGGSSHEAAPCLLASQRALDVGSGAGPITRCCVAADASGLYVAAGWTWQDGASGTTRGAVTVTETLAGGGTSASRPLPMAPPLDVAWSPLDPMHADKFPPLVVAACADGTVRCVEVGETVCRNVLSFFAPLARAVHARAESDPAQLGSAAEHHRAAEAVAVELRRAAAARWAAIVAGLSTRTGRGAE